jgi:hypothetical protein
MNHARNNAAAPLVSVTDGRAAIGHIVAHGKLGFEAFDRSDVSIGMFKTQPAAANAIYNAMKGDGHAK